MKKPTHIRIRKSNYSDSNDVLRLIKQLEPELTNKDLKKVREIFEAIIEKENYLNKVAILRNEKNRKKIIGFISLVFNLTIHDLGLVATINEIVIDKNYRNKKVGSILLENAIGDAKSRGCTEIEVSSSLDRKTAHKFYKKHGFKEVGKFFSKEAEI
ncbi:Aminoalkylphosphonate N-acetyltransferase [subsurface metagenome]